jgi:ribosomal protein L7/L12
MTREKTMKNLAGSQKVSQQTVNGEQHRDTNEDNKGVLLLDIGAQKIQVTKTVRELTGVGLKEAKDIVDTVVSRPQLLAYEISGQRANFVIAALAAVGALAVVVTTKNGEIDGTLHTKITKDAEKKHARHDAVMALLRNKVVTQLQSFSSELEEELDWFVTQLTDSGVDVGIVPEWEVTVDVTQRGSMLSLSVKFGN